MIKFAVADSETDPFDGETIPKPFIWGYYDGSSYKEFNDTAEFAEFIYSQEVILYAHHGGKFDWIFLAKYFPVNERLLLINGRISKLQFGACEIRDSYNILPVALDKFNKSKFDYNKLKKGNRKKYKKEISDYLKSDCVNLYHAVAGFINVYGQHLTIAGAALHQWRKICKTKNPKSSQKHYHNLKKYYFGGRVECFKKGLIDHKFKVIDINSAYSYAMMIDHPVGKIEYYDTLPKSKTKIARSFITLDCVASGCFPLRGADGCLSFPNDNILRRYNVTGHEYLAAVDTQSIRDINILTVMLQRDTISFKKYIEHFHSIKKAAVKNSPEYIFAKLFLNSLYGKLAADPDKYSEYKIVRSSEVMANVSNGEGWEINAPLTDTKFIIDKPLNEDDKKFLDVGTGASITGYVRAMLWRAICQCEGVIYCDTDSIACKETGALPIHKSDLGAWDIEGHFVRGGIAGKKMYCFYPADKKQDCKIASKGVKLTADEIMIVAGGGVVEFNPIAPTMSLAALLSPKGMQHIKRTIKMT